MRPHLYRALSRRLLRTDAGRFLCIALVWSQIGLALPRPASAAVVRKAPPPPSLELLQTARPAAPNVTVNRRRPDVDPAPIRPTFSTRPTADEITRARVFGEPLVPVGPPPSAAENAELARVVGQYHASGRPDRIAPLLEFLARHPQTSWRAAIQLQAGLIFARTGYISRALHAWEEAWHLAKDATDRRQRAIADVAVAEWLELAVKLGQVERAAARVKELAGRTIGGPAGSRVRMAREGLYILQHRHHLAWASGTLALEMVLRERSGRDFVVPTALAQYHPTPAGTSLVELQQLAQQVGLPWRMARRTTALAEFVVPSVLHLRSDHYTALLRVEGDRYLLRDPILGGDMWVTREALVDEASGYALVPDALPPGWREAGEAEAAGVIGHCQPGAPGNDEPCDENCLTGGPPPSPPESPSSPGEAPPSGSPPSPGSPPGPGSPPPGNSGCGMPVYAFHPVKASLLIWDIPLGYSPPRGPAVQFRLSYDHREALQPQTFTFSNLGPMWTFDWLSYITEQPVVCPQYLGSCVPAHATVFLRGSGQEAFVTPDANGVYPRHWRSQAVLVRVSDDPVRYERRLPDGGIEVFTQSDGAPSGQRRVFLTEAIDPLGQRLQFTYDAQLRLVAVTDAIGHVTSLAYAHPGDPLKITQVTDPFGRSATLTYTAAGQLASVTDVIGLTSRFAYGQDDFISSLDTPYGATRFRHEPTPAAARFIEATDPLGGTEHLEFHFQDAMFAASAPGSEVPSGFAAHNSYLDYYNTVYWDKRAWSLHPGDISKATLTHWLIKPPPVAGHGSSVPVPHSRKRPLEGRVWYAYPNQSNLRYIGSGTQPTRVGRVLDDGASQLTEATYNTLGSLLTLTDPLGRQISYTYDSDGHTLLQVRQTTGGASEVLTTYSNLNTLRQPQTVTDAAGQSTTLTYNAAGQVLSVTNARNQTTTLGYDGDGRLLTVSGPVAGAITTYTYDAYGRRRTVTDSEGYTLTTDYDLFDRAVRVTYPNGTYDAWTYDRLDLSTVRDRLGRLSRIYYDALRRPIAMRDPLGRTVTQEWCGCGALAALTDPNGNRTTWERDIQSRVTRELRANGSATLYQYDSAGRLTQRTDPKGQHTQYSYFTDGQLAQVVYPNAENATPTVSVTYDAAYGRLTTMNDGIGTTSYTYRPVGQLGALAVESVDGPLADDTVSFGYDELGRVVSRTRGSATNTWAYDGLGRLVTQGDPTGTFTYEYAGMTNRPTTVTYPNNQTSTYAYYPNSGSRRLEDIHHRTPTGATLSRFTYTYDAVGNIETWTQQYEATTRAYDFTYDAADQLTGAIYRTTGPTPTVLKRYGYVYDAAENRTTEQIDDAPRTWDHDSMNRITTQAGGGHITMAGSVSEPSTVTIQARPMSVNAAHEFAGTAVVATGTNVVAITATDASGNTGEVSYEVDVDAANSTFAYDANGNLAAQGTRTYEWNARDQLVRVSDGGTETMRFAYDGFGRRAERVAAGVSRVYVYDGTDVLEERMLGGSALRHVHGPSIDQPLVTVAPTGASTYYLADHLGSIVQTTDSAAQITLTRRYDPYGRPVTGAATAGYAFTGREWDAEAALYYYRARYFEPDIARFLSADPIAFAGGPNFYTYVRNRPTLVVDPTGHNGVLAGRLAAAGGLCVADGPLPFGELLAGLLLLDALINYPYLSNKQAPPAEGAVKLPGDQGWRDSQGNIWKKDKLHKDHWDVSDRKGRKIKEVDAFGRQIWPDGPKNKNKK